jgi:hypothetical protein
MVIALAIQKTAYDILVQVALMGVGGLFSVSFIFQNLRL